MFNNKFLNKLDLAFVISFRYNYVQFQKLHYILLYITYIHISNLKLDITSKS